MNNNPPTGAGCRRKSQSRWALFMVACFSLIVLFNTSAFAQTSSAAKISATASTNKLQIAEPFTVDFKITAPAGTRIKLPPIGKQFGGFDVIDHQDTVDIPSNENADDRVWSRRLTLESIETGETEVPALEVRANSQTIASRPIPIDVISILEGQADPTQIRDIQSVVDIDVPQPRSNNWVWWLAGGCGLFALAAASVFAVTKRKTWITPSQWALTELEGLSKTKAAQNGDSETVSLRLSEVLRGYLELQFEVSAPLKTTNELLSDVESKQLLDPKLAKQFADIFQLSDLSKFAGVQLPPTKLASAIEKSKALVTEASGRSSIAQTQPAGTN